MNNSAYQNVSDEEIVFRWNLLIEKHNQYAKDLEQLLIQMNKAQQELELLRKEIETRGKEVAAT